MTILDKKPLIQKIINVFETGTPEGKYDKLVIYDDGVNGSHQITYGRSQTTEQGNLARLIEVRHQWLKYHEKPILRRTIYRTQTFLNEITRANWALDSLPINANGVDVT